ncbi:MAG: NAD(P)-dependent dehydrogenase (short-subunit alcohol dehydrogenase family) [Acidimicrobiales bacterium]|jgi:NAD(P)-dependent dehydrogenase (short-subunit alcohol dehydrogenase family)
MDEKSLTGRTALVTGAQQGIGRATALALAAAGASVVVNHFNDPAAAEELAREVEGFEVGAVIVQGDVSSRDDCENLVAAGDALGGVDLLVNNAGIFPRTPFLELTDADWDAVMTTNLTSTFRCSQLVARRVVEAGGTGAIVNLASVAAYRPSPRGAHYSASKGGIVGFTHTAAVELAPLGVRMNCVAPGLVDTAQPRDGMSEGQIADASSTVPRGQMATPADIADVVVFLLSDAARHVTGQTLHVNGGQYTV